MSDHDIIKRIAERGLALAQRENPAFIDIFQHLLDEIERCVILPKDRTCRTCHVVKRKSNGVKPRTRIEQPIRSSQSADGVGRGVGVSQGGVRPGSGESDDPVARPDPHDDDG